MTDPVVVLDWQYLNALAHDGLDRALRYLNNGWRQTYEHTPDGIATHVVGVACEGAVAVWRGHRGWRPEPEPDPQGDVEVGLQVRGTVPRPGRRSSLIVRAGDNGGHAFVFVEWDAPAPRFTIRGWLLGDEARQDQHRVDLRSWFVEPEHLRHPSTLPPYEPPAAGSSPRTWDDAYLKGNP